MITDAQLLKFRSQRHGCLSPSGDLISCDPYEHFSVMGVEDHYKEIYVQYWADAREQVEWEAENFADDDGYYHPEWHRFEMGDNTRELTYLEAYRRGWVRLTTDSRRGVMWAESTQATIDKNKKNLQFIADCINLTLDISVQK